MDTRENTSLQGSFEVRKTVRFIAEPLKGTNSVVDYLQINHKGSHDDKYDLLGGFLEKFSTILTESKKLFFYEGSNSLKGFFKVKYKFLQNHTRYDFYKLKSKEKMYLFNQLDYLEPYLHNYFGSIEEIYNILDAYQGAKKEKQNRYREIGFYLQKLGGNKLSILKELFEFLVKTNKPGIDKQIDEIKKQLPNFEKALVELIKEYGPNNGLEIAKGSLNYYILNKSSKSYFDKKIDTLKNDQTLKLNELRGNSVFYLKYKDENENDILVNLDEVFFQNIGLSKGEIEKMTLEEAYHFLKEFKAKRKSAFNQFVGDGYSLTLR